MQNYKYTSLYLNNCNYFNIIFVKRVIKLTRKILKKNIIKKTTKEEFLFELIKIIEDSILKFINFIKTNCNSIITGHNIQRLISEFTNGNILDFKENTFLYFQKYLDFNTQKVYTQNTLNYINVILNFFYSLNYGLNMGVDNSYHPNNIRNEILYNYGMKDKINCCGFYFLNYDSKKYEISFSSEKQIIDYINDKNIGEYFWLFTSSKTIEDKKLYMNEIAIKIRPYFNEKHCEKQVTVLDSEITKDRRKDLKKRLNGYFLHDAKENNSSDAKERSSFTDQEKNIILDKTFIDILYCLAILRLNNLLDYKK